MRFLLDTHALLWAVSEPAKLSARARNAIADRGNGLAVSAASAWEIGTKYRLGKLAYAAPIVQNFAGVVARLGASVLSVDVEHALYAGTMPWVHRDPFDRMLAAQSVLENLPLITSDNAFDDLEGVRAFW